MIFICFGKVNKVSNLSWNKNWVYSNNNFLQLDTTKSIISFKYINVNNEQFQQFLVFLQLTLKIHLPSGKVKCYRSSLIVLKESLFIGTQSGPSGICRDVFRTLWNIYDGALFKCFQFIFKESFIEQIWYGPKYAWSVYVLH